MEKFSAYLSRYSAPTQAHIPTVYVKVKVYHVFRLREVEQKYEIDFTLMLDWIDPSVAEQVHNLDKREANAYNLTGHFLPDVLIDNAISDNVTPVGGSQKPRLEFNDESWRNGHVKLTQRYRIELNQQFHVHKFPFDQQDLLIEFKSKTVLLLARSWQVQLADGVDSPRADNEHSIDERCRMEDWCPLSIEGICGRAQHDNKRKVINDLYTVKFKIMREPSTGFWMFQFPLLTTGLLSFTVYGVLPSDIGDRESIIVTLVLTVTAFKFVLSNSIPPVAYLTDVDRLIITTTCLLILQGFMCVLAGIVERNMPLYALYGLSSGRVIDATLGGILGLITSYKLISAWFAYKAALRRKTMAQREQQLLQQQNNTAMAREHRAQSTNHVQPVVAAVAEEGSTDVDSTGDEASTTALQPALMRKHRRHKKKKQQ